MTTRGVMKPNVSTITNSFLGEFKTDKHLTRKIYKLYKKAIDKILEKERLLKKLKKGFKLQPKFDEKWA